MPAGAFSVTVLAMPLPLTVSVSTIDGRIELRIAALGELGRRSVDRAGHARGVAAQGEGLGIVARLEDHDPGVGPAGRRAQVEGAVAAERDAAVGAARAGIVAAGVEDRHPGAGDARVAGDRETPSLDDVEAAIQRERAVSRNADLAVNAGLDRRGRVPAQALGAVVGQAGGARRRAARPAGRATTAAPVVGAD